MDEDRGNRAVAQAYEPGSVEKVLTMAALADKGLVKPDSLLILAGVGAGFNFAASLWRWLPRNLETAT